MKRYSNNAFQLRFAMLMVIYALLLVFEWPYAVRLSDTPVKIALAVLPAVPVAFAVLLWARQVLHSDEPERRIHLVTLSIAAGVISVASIAGALLLIAFKVHVSGALLFWVFPALAVVYGFLRHWMRWRRSGNRDGRN